MRGSGFLWQALNHARAANLATEGAPPVVQGESGQSRRALLIGLAASGFAASLPTSARARTSAGPVAIVGGGIAGLTALWQLTRAGVDARLFEARSRLGGRMYTARVPGLERLEMGAQLVNSDHHDMAELARTFGVGLIDRKAGRHATLLLADGRAIPEAEAVAALRPIAAQLTRDADRLDRDPKGAAAELDRYSFASYLDKHRAKLSEPWVRSLLEASARTEYGVEPHEASAIELMFNLPSVEGARVDVLSRSDERYVIAGGSSALVDAMAARLRPRIATGRAVAAIDPAPQGVRLRFADGTHFDAAAVIVATPVSITRRIAFGVPLPALWRRYLAEVALGRNEKVQALMRARPWEAPLGRGGELWHCDAGAVASGWEGSVRPHPGDATAGGVWTWFLGGDQVARAASGDAKAQALAFAAGADEALPGMLQATMSARRTAWHRDPLTLGGYVNYRPGQLTRFAPLIWVEGRGRAVRPLGSGLVHFAGEHLSDAYPGYMNGAAQTGRLAAQAVIADLAEAQAA